MPTYVLFFTHSQMHNNAYPRKPINQKMPKQNNVIGLYFFFFWQKVMNKNMYSWKVYYGVQLKTTKTSKNKLRI